MFLKKSKLTKLFFATDIHGSEKCWLKLVNSGAFYEVDTIILGGDMTGKGIQALLEVSPGTWKTNFLGEEIEVDDQEALAKVEAKVRNAGFYPHRFSPDEFEQFVASEDYQESIFRQEMKRVIVPGGQVMVLEMTFPRKSIYQGAYRLYLHRILPRVARAFSRNPAAYEYLADSIMNFPDPEAFARLMEEAGLVHVVKYPLDFGITYLHIGVKS